MKTIEISLSDCNSDAESEVDFQKRRIRLHLKKLEKKLIRACESGAFSGGLEMVEKDVQVKNYFLNNRDRGQDELRRRK